MKTYSSLSIDVIHFDAQDVVTASVACICAPSCCTGDYMHRDSNNNDINCPAESHLCGYK